MCVHRIPLPTSVTIASRPSYGCGTDERKPLIWGRHKAKYFSRRDWTTQIALNHLTKSRFTRAIFRSSKSCGRRNIGGNLPGLPVVGQNRSKWVKVKRNQYEYTSSALPLNSDIARRSRHFALVPTTDILSYAHRPN